jgi:hypothetical protein
VHQLENPLNGVVAEIQQVSDRTVAEGRILLDFSISVSAISFAPCWLIRISSESCEFFDIRQTLWLLRVELLHPVDSCLSLFLGLKRAKAAVALHESVFTTFHVVSLDG